MGFSFIVRADSASVFVSPAGEPLCSLGPSEERFDYEAADDWLDLCDHSLEDWNEFEYCWEYAENPYND